MIATRTDAHSQKRGAFSPHLSFMLPSRVGLCNFHFSIQACLVQFASQCPLAPLKLELTQTDSDWAQWQRSVCDWPLVPHRFSWTAGEPGHDGDDYRRHDRWHLAPSVTAHNRADHTAVWHLPWQATLEGHSLAASRKCAPLHSIVHRLSH